MTMIELFACAGMIVGFFCLLHLKPVEFTDTLFGFLLRKPRTLKEEINETTRRKKPGILKKEIQKAQEILTMTGRGNRFSLICALSLAFFLAGGSFAILIGNFFLAPVMAAGFLFVPFWYVRLTESHYKKNVSAELETALSIITTAYLRNEELLTAVEENVHYLNPPVNNVFQDFLTQVKLVNPDMEAALKVLKGRIENDVFKEWCDALSDCQLDRSLKTTLTPIVNKMSDMRIVNADLELFVTEPRKEFITMVLLVLGNIPLMYFLNQGWYETLMFSPIGQIILAVSAALIFICTARVIKLTKPLEYRR
ncbi:hypothetical protein D5278_06750 [bacterium 1XD21-13]|nr:hypothetical protein [bacterium 1XD21-13]